MIPVYKELDKILVEEQDIIKFPIHSNDYQSVKEYFNYLRDKVCLVKYECDIKVLKKLNDIFNNRENNCFLLINNGKEIKNPDFLLRKIFKFLLTNQKNLLILKS